MRRRTQRYLWPGLELVAFWALDLGAHVVLPDVERMRPVDFAARMPDLPALIVAGAEDDRATPDDARRIAAPLPRARVVIAPGRNHEDVPRYLQEPEGRAEMRRFVNEIATAASR